MPITAMKSLLFKTSLALLAAAAFTHAAPLPDSIKTSGFAIGCQAWTFNKFSVFEAIEKTAQAGGKTIEFFPGQKLSAEEPAVKFDHNSPAEVIEKVKAKCKSLNVTPVAYGVVGLSTDEASSRKVFEFAKALGILCINTESVEALDTAEKLVKEFDVKVGIHDHPKRPDNPSYRVWDPNYVLEVTKDRDPRIGACADTGHWVRSGLKPVDCLRILKGRIMSSHLKDLHAPLPSGHDVIYGTGVSDIKGTLAEFKEQGFEGPISIEYEYKMEDNLEEVKGCMNFIRSLGTNP
ncbi:MAG: Xylose isomerase domain protein barrel [Chthoniobacteraceae bacterium]|nr:Xylose isomerase domain protein barrel [Chthoniobacteraceae bacterium]